MFVSRRFVLFVAILVLSVLGFMYKMQTACWSGKIHLRQSSLHFQQRLDAVEHFKFKMTEDGDEISFDRLHPRDQTPESSPGLVPSVVHYIWCGNKKFRFKDYLGVVSAIKLFGPLKLVFHYTHPPKTDDYNVWFKELTSATPGLEMQEMSSAPSCGSVAMLQTALGFLSVDGGIFVGENIIMSHDLNLPLDTEMWFAFSNETLDKTRGVVIAKHGFSKSLEDAYLTEITSSASTKPRCVPSDSFRLSDKDTYCVVVPGVVYPRDILDSHTPFAELARMIFYGRREPMTPERNASSLIPRISHYVRFKAKKGRYHVDFPFCHFLSVLSALYVAGFERVYMHVDVEPSGRWFQELAKENVTVVKVVRANSVFQQPVDVIHHVSDISRYLILNKFGGAYQDFDVTWTSHVPDSLLSYPFVAALDWVGEGEWPDKFNLGVMLTRPHAKWLQYYIESHKDFRDSNWGFNSLLMSYKMYELHPHLMYLDRQLQVICHNEICHPTWERSYLRRAKDTRPTMPFRWQDVRSIHVTQPKPAASLVSPQTVRDGKDMFAEIGRFILEKSGRLALMSEFSSN